MTFKFNCSEGPWEVSINDCGEFAGWPSIEPVNRIDNGGDLDFSVVHTAGFRHEYWENLGLKETIANAKMISQAFVMAEFLNEIFDLNEDEPIGYQRLCRIREILEAAGGKDA